MPTVSVIIPVFNRQAYITDAVNSTLAQTFRDLELIIIDDGSTDRTPEILDSFDDPRIRILRNDTNRGIPAARNKGLSMARGRYVAWQDSDDLMSPGRIAVQAEYLDAHKEIAMLGSCARKCDTNGRSLFGVKLPPITWDDIRAWQLFLPAFQQSSVMGRTGILTACPYNEYFTVCEDFDVFIRLAREHMLVNLPRILVTRRKHETQSVQIHKDLNRSRLIELLRGQLKLIGIDAGETDMQNHFLFGHMNRWRYAPDMEYLQWAEDWLIGLRKANQNRAYCAPDSMAFVTGLFWAVACWHARKRIGLRAYRIFSGSPLNRSLIGRNGRRWLKHYLSLVLRD